eukprot:g4294.t1
MHDVDDSFGKIMKALQKKEVYHDATILLLSDNGANPWFGGSNYPLRGLKGGVHEGGMRVPFFLKLPFSSSGAEEERRMNGLLSYKKLAHITDIYPTLLGFIEKEKEWTRLDKTRGVPYDLDGHDLSLDLVELIHQSNSKPESSHHESHRRQSPDQRFPDQRFPDQQSLDRESPPRALTLQVMPFTRSAAFRKGKWKLTIGAWSDTYLYRNMNIHSSLFGSILGYNSIGEEATSIDCIIEFYRNALEWIYSLHSTTNNASEEQQQEQIKSLDNDNLVGQNYSSSFFTQEENLQPWFVISLMGMRVILYDFFAHGNPFYRIQVPLNVFDPAGFEFLDDLSGTSCNYTNQLTTTATTTTEVGQSSTKPKQQLRIGFFNLDNDPTESHNLAMVYPKKCGEMIHEFKKSLQPEAPKITSGVTQVISIKKSSYKSSSYKSSSKSRNNPMFLRPFLDSELEYRKLETDNLEKNNRNLMNPNEKLDPNQRFHHNPSSSKTINKKPAKRNDRLKCFLFILGFCLGLIWEIGFDVLGETFCSILFDEMRSIDPFRAIVHSLWDGALFLVGVEWALEILKEDSVANLFLEWRWDCFAIFFFWGNLQEIVVDLAGCGWIWRFHSQWYNPVMFKLDLTGEVYCALPQITWCIAPLAFQLLALHVVRWERKHGYRYATSLFCERNAVIVDSVMQSKHNPLRKLRGHQRSD